MKKNLLTAVLTVCMGWLSMSAWALDQKDGVYQIANGDDLVAFSNLAIGEPDASAVLTADIDLAGKNFEPIGMVGVPYTGKFNGQEHRVKNMFLEDANGEYLGLFGVISGGAEIRNVIIDKSCFVSAKGLAAGLIGGTNGNGEVLIENCGNEADVDVIEANAGGILGVNMGSGTHITIRGCWNTGTIAGGRESAAISGWLGDNAIIVGLYNTGEVYGVDGDGRDLFRSNGIGSGKMEKCFSVNTTQNGVTNIDLATVATGALTYLMNGNTSVDPIWFQNLDNGSAVDAYPVPFANHGVVYAVGTLNCDGTPQGGADSFSNTDSSVPTPHAYVDGICDVCGHVDKGYATLAEDGFYEIGNVKELNWFAALVNGGDNEVNARLTADLDFSDYTLENNVMIGTSNRFKGVFDGQEHSIKVDYYRDERNAALFCYLEKATIKNLVVTGNIESSEQFAAGLFVESWGATLIENVVVKVDIIGTLSGDATYGGFGAVAHDDILFQNCAMLGSILGDNIHGIGGMVGYTHGGGSTRFINCLMAASDIFVNTSDNNAVICRNNPTVRNCYTFDTFGLREENGAIFVAESTAATGELCYNLNAQVSGGEDWFQNIGEETMPVPFASHKKVYAAGQLNCMGVPVELTYSNNEGQPTRPNHEYDADGICLNCDSRLVKTADQLAMVAEDINFGLTDGFIDITLDADIDMSAIIDFQGIGTREAPFKGHFDGQGHIISNMIIQAENDNHGLIGVVSGDVTVKNVTVDATCSVSLYEAGYAGGIVGATIGGGSLLIENCGNEAEIYTEGANASGIFGVNDLSQMAVTIRNCYNTGEITGLRESAGISGWLGRNAVVENCYNIGYITGLDGNKTFAREDGGTQFINCYENMGNQVEYVEFYQIESGELCYNLNGSKNGVARFFQNIGTDEHPVLHGSAALVYFDGTDYTNTPTGIVNVSAELAKKGAEIYTIGGTRVNEMQKGVNIVRMADGKVKKYIVK